MRFGQTALEACAGALLAHKLVGRGWTFAKGHRLAAEDIRRIRDAGIESLIVARPEPGDILEDEAAARLARAIAGEGLGLTPAATGRVNLIAQSDGILELDAALIDRLNRIDEGLTLATLPPFSHLKAGQMAATVKIIPFALDGAHVAAGEALGASLTLRPIRALRYVLIQTMLPHLPEKLLVKTEAIMAARVAGLGGTLVATLRTDHREDALAALIRSATAREADIILMLGASAITDRRDALPAALDAAGGRVLHLGMPVDPGNLLMLGEFDGRPVIGLPGCARSPALNGADFVLERLAAGIEVDGAMIARMGVGGLLKESPARPSPRRGRRAARDRDMPVAGILLAAGLSRRMGARNKLLLSPPDDRRPMVRIAAETALAAGLKPLIVVLGHQPEAVREALDGLDACFVRAEDFAAGLGHSLRAGVRALPESCGQALVLLGDMPRLRVETLQAIIRAGRDEEAAAIVPFYRGKRGNPVLWRRRCFEDLALLTGDQGARHLIDQAGDAVVRLAVDDPGVLLDVDDESALARLQAAREDD